MEFLSNGKDLILDQTIEMIISQEAMEASFREIKGSTFQPIDAVSRK